jgi:peptidoglycan/xylan/chitin deacetylase (PgdA/CDA1 family)
VLGCLAERYPQTLIERIAGAGHELASHGYNHHLLSSLSDAEFREDAYRSKALLEDIAGRAVWGIEPRVFPSTCVLSIFWVNLGMCTIRV